VARRQKRGGDDGSFWISYSDLATALMLVFILITVYYITQTMRTQDELIKAKAQVEELIKLREELAESIKAAVDKTNAKLRSQSGEPSFKDVFLYDAEREEVHVQAATWFDSNEFLLKGKGEDHLRIFYVELYDALLRRPEEGREGLGPPHIPEYLSSIDVLGHTDPLRRKGAGEARFGRYNGRANVDKPKASHTESSNLYLSQRRAKAVVDFIQSLYESGAAEDIALVKDRPFLLFAAVLNTAGRSWVSAYCYEHGGETRILSRDDYTGAGGRPCPIWDEPASAEDSPEWVARDTANKKSRRVTFGFQMDDRKQLDRLKQIIDESTTDQGGAP
jgi:outer membrane protein OmpA-like peptidoglycan-associated protein